MSNDNGESDRTIEVQEVHGQEAEHFEVFGREIRGALHDVRDLGQGIHEGAVSLHDRIADGLHQGVEHAEQLGQHRADDVKRGLAGVNHALHKEISPGEAHLAVALEGKALAKFTSIAPLEVFGEGLGQWLENGGTRQIDAVLSPFRFGRWLSTPYHDERDRCG